MFVQIMLFLHTLIWSGDPPAQPKCRYIHVYIHKNAEAGIPDNKGLYLKAQAAVKSSGMPWWDARMQDMERWYYNPTFQAFPISLEDGDVMASVKLVKDKWKIELETSFQLSSDEVPVELDELGKVTVEEKGCKGKRDATCKVLVQELSVQKDINYPLRNLVGMIHFACGQGYVKHVKPLKELPTSKKLEELSKDLLVAVAALEELSTDLNSKYLAIQPLPGQLGVFSKNLSEQTKKIVTEQAELTRADIRTIPAKVRDVSPHITRGQRSGVIIGSSVGLILSLVGASFLAVDGRCTKTLGDPVKLGNACQHIYRSLLPGAVFMGAGLGSLTGTAIWFTAAMTNPKWQSTGARFGVGLQFRF